MCRKVFFFFFLGGGLLSFFKSTTKDGLKHARRTSSAFIMGRFTSQNTFTKHTHTDTDDTTRFTDWLLALK